MRSNLDYTLLFIISFVTTFVLMATVLVFLFMARRKIMVHKLATKELQITMQKEILNAVIESKEQEHIRIARDLHDEVSSKLNALRMNVHILKSDNLTKTERKEIGDNSLEACKLLIDSTRQISHNLMPPTLEYIGLNSALLELANEFTITDQLVVNYTNLIGDRFFNHLKHEDQIHVYRIIQELINNSIRHGKATEICIILTNDANTKTIEYIDNGIGMKNKQGENLKGIGINNIHSRAKIIQANASYDYFFQNGCRFVLTF